jgi:isoaspartyl peptidase/L-asparaginase-like protein (Ntn-hydrolase superfamily)
MEKTDHILLVGKGANDFAAQNGIDEVPMEELVTPEAIAEWEKYRKYKTTVGSLFAERYVC